MKHRFVAVVLALSLAGCESITGVRNQGLEDARQRWELFGPASYDFDFQWLCFCGGSVVRPVTISVRNGAFTGAVYVDSGTTADTTYFRDALTVDRIFAFLRREIATRPAAYTAIYDTVAGYPRQAFIDYDAQTADEERGMRIDALRPVP